MTIEEKAKDQAEKITQTLLKKYKAKYFVLSTDALETLFRRAFMRGANAQLIDLYEAIK